MTASEAYEVRNQQPERVRAGADHVGECCSCVPRLREQNKKSSDERQKRIADTESHLESTRALMREAAERHNAKQPEGQKHCGISGYGQAAAASIIEESQFLEARVQKLRDALFDVTHAVIGETENHTFGKPSYDMTLDHLYEVACGGRQVLYDD